MVLKPATPGFLVTLTATILLAVVSFNVPYFKSIYFLQATYSSGSNSGSILLGTMGYCVTANGNQTCTKPSIGYEFNPNALLGDNISLLQIPTVVTKWLTYALFLHVIALACAGISAIFGGLAHIREFSMTCASSCISGLAASITLVAFIFDLVLFFLARTRIREVKGSTATIGNAIWLTLAAWVLLFISGCMYTIGRCCLSSRPRAPRAGKGDEAGIPIAPVPKVDDSYAERMRLEAIKAEVDRKARQQASDSRREGQLPAFEEYEIETRPLTGPDSESDHLPTSPYRDQPTPGGHSRFGAAGAATGYAPTANNPYAPQRQPSLSPSVYSTNNAGGGAYGRNQNFNAVGYPPMPQGPSYGGQYGQNAGYGGQQSSYAAPGRRPSLTEGNIYENAGLGAAAGVAAGVAANNYLHPGQPHGRGDSYGQHSQHSQASSYHSAYSQQPYYPHPQDPSAIYAQNQGYTTPYDPPQQPAVSADDWHPGMSADPFAQSPRAYNASNPYAVAGVASSSTLSDAYNKPLPTPSSGSYGQSTPPADLNFPGVAGRPLPGTPVDNGGWRSPSSPQRLHGWREESEPSTMGRTGGNILEADPGPSHDAPPPEYEPSDRSTPAARNEKLTFRQ